MRCVRLGIVLGVWGLVVAALAADARADAKVEEQVVGPASEQGTIYAVSPRGMHVATVSMKGSRWVVTLDGAAWTAGAPITSDGRHVLVRTAHGAA